MADRGLPPPALALVAVAGRRLSAIELLPGKISTPIPFAHSTGCVHWWLASLWFSAERERQTVSEFAAEEGRALTVAPVNGTGESGPVVVSLLLARRADAARMREIPDEGRTTSPSHGGGGAGATSLGLPQVLTYLDLELCRTALTLFARGARWTVSLSPLTPPYAIFALVIDLRGVLIVAS